MKKTTTILCLFAILFFTNCKTKSSLNDSVSNDYRIAFYNVENLFDTKDDPKTADEEFMPTSKKKWTEERYQEKLNHLTKVVAGMEYPAILGVAEVENAGVLEDWCRYESMAKYDYGIVHFDSPDFRGIDVGLLYQKKAFKVEKAETIEINFPKEIVEDYTTRDVLVVTGKLRDLPVTIFVNHWPSRRGGVAESEPKRMYVAQQVRKKVDEILAVNPKASLILMGDFNDEPENNSLRKGLNASYDMQREIVTTDLKNCMTELDMEGKGSYNYRGNWNMLDQILITRNLEAGRNGWLLKNVVVFQEDWMMYEDKKHGARPSRTYGGPRYFGGYSDHLPVYIDLIKL
jgi:predicted extracellular nuclease